MGWRFRKSFKIVPGVKLNLNKKSSSVTFGGKGFHYTVNSKGKRTKTVGIPGSGLYYTETTGGGRQNNPTSPPPRPPIQNNNVSSTNNSGRKNRGCLFWLIAFIVFCFALALYSIMWIPAIGFIIYFAVRRDCSGTRTRNILISAVVMVTSLILFAMMMASPDLTSIQAEWGKTEFDISETTEVKITGYPDDAEITNLELSENSIAELEYSDGKAIITFTDTGEAALFFTANGDVTSTTATITVVDRKAEEQARKAAEEQAEQERLAQEKAEQEAQAQAEKEAAEQAAAEQAAQEQAQLKQAQQAEQNSQAQTEPQEQMVWIPQSGSKYHSNPSCSGMNNPTQVTISEAQSMGYEPCKKCY